MWVATLFHFRWVYIDKNVKKQKNRCIWLCCCMAFVEKSNNFFLAVFKCKWTSFSWLTSNIFCISVKIHTRKNVIRNLNTFAITWICHKKQEHWRKFVFYLFMYRAPDDVFAVYADCYILLLLLPFQYVRVSLLDLIIKKVIKLPFYV